jgi:hypothetical protein
VVDRRRRGARGRASQPFRVVPELARAPQLDVRRVPLPRPVRRLHGSREKLRAALRKRLCRLVEVFRDLEIVFHRVGARTDLRFFESRVEVLRRFGRLDVFFRVDVLGEIGVVLVFNPLPGLAFEHLFVERLLLQVDGLVVDKVVGVPDIVLHLYVGELLEAAVFIADLLFDVVQLPLPLDLVPQLELNLLLLVHFVDFENLFRDRLAAVEIEGLAVLEGGRELVDLVDPVHFHLRVARLDELGLLFVVDIFCLDEIVVVVFPEEVVQLLFQISFIPRDLLVVLLPVLVRDDVVVLHFVEAELFELLRGKAGGWVPFPAGARS